MITLTREQVVDGLRAIAADSPNRIVGKDDCRYFVDRAPSCIVGELLHRLGYTEGDLSKDVDTEFEPNNAGIDELMEYGIVDVAPSVGAVLEDVQAEQDRQTPWGESVRMALGGVV
jgi:hypothetical protein